jgi:hypothetical protein
MQEKKEKVFADGFSFKRNETAPDYVVGRLSLKVDDAVAFIKKHANSNGWINLSIMYGRSGNPYVELDTYEPAKQSSEPQEVKKSNSTRKSGSNPIGNIESNFTEDAIRDLVDDEDLPF